MRFDSAGCMPFPSKLNYESIPLAEMCTIKQNFFSLFLANESNCAAD